MNYYIPGLWYKIYQPLHGVVSLKSALSRTSVKEALPKVITPNNQGKYTNWTMDKK